MAGYYSVDEIRDLQQVKEIFADGPDTMNWLFLSTSGVHGSYETLDDIEEEWDEPDASHYITILVLHPRMVWSKYGHIELENKEDIAWLRKIVTESLDAVRESQEGNLLTDATDLSGEHNAEEQANPLTKDKKQ